MHSICKIYDVCAYICVQTLSNQSGLYLYKVPGYCSVNVGLSGLGMWDYLDRACLMSGPDSDWLEGT